MECISYCPVLYRIASSILSIVSYPIGKSTQYHITSVYNYKVMAERTHDSVGSFFVGEGCLPRRQPHSRSPLLLLDVCSSRCRNQKPLCDNQRDQSQKNQHPCTPSHVHLKVPSKWQHLQLLQIQQGTHCSTQGQTPRKPDYTHVSANPACEVLHGLWKNLPCSAD